jgi:hypothetical protein
MKFKKGGGGNKYCFRTNIYTPVPKLKPKYLIFFIGPSYKAFRNQCKNTDFLIPILSYLKKKYGFVDTHIELLEEKNVLTLLKFIFSFSLWKFKKKIDSPLVLYTVQCTVQCTVRGVEFFIFWIFNTRYLPTEFGLAKEFKDQSRKGVCLYFHEFRCGNGF